MVAWWLDLGEMSDLKNSPNTIKKLLYLISLVILSFIEKQWSKTILLKVYWRKYYFALYILSMSQCIFILMKYRLI